MPRKLADSLSLFVTLPIIGLVASLMLTPPAHAQQQVAVDAISTGFSFVLQDILARNGLAAGDYKLVPFGNTGARWQALQKQEAVAGLLTPPISQAAVAQGYVNLGEAADILGGYQGGVA